MLGHPPDEPQLILEAEYSLSQAKNRLADDEMKVMLNSIEDYKSSRRREVESVESLNGINIHQG
jgi:hypothetical protein